jgi:hypothetical protein
MRSLFKQLRQFTEDELLQLSEAVDQEITSRTANDGEVPDSARRRAVRRSQSYRQSTGSSAPPVRFAGLKEKRKRKFAA